MLRKLSASIVDVWADYHRLANEEGWTQQRIAEAKGQSKGVVAERIRYHALPDNVKDMCSDGVLTEGHLQPISTLVLTSELHDWLTLDQITIELAEKIKRDAGKNGSKSVKATREDAGRTSFPLTSTVGI